MQKQHRLDIALSRFLLSIERRCMALKGGQDRSFYPEVVYPLAQVAENLMVSEKWVKDNLIHNGSCAYKRQGNTYVFLGQWLINWCRSDFEKPVESRGRLESTSGPV